MTRETSAFAAPGHAPVEFADPTGTGITEPASGSATSVNAGRGPQKVRPNVEGNRRADETLAKVKACAGAFG